MRRCSIPLRSRTEHIAALNSLKIAGAGGARLAPVRRAGRGRDGEASGAGPQPRWNPSPASLVLPSLVYGLAALVVANLVGIQPSLWLTVAGHIVVFGPLMYRAAVVVAQGIDPSLEEASTIPGRHAA